MISGTRNFIGIEFNKTLDAGDLSFRFVINGLFLYFILNKKHKLAETQPLNMHMRLHTQTKF